MEVSYEYKKVTSKRSTSIFSVLSSPNRVDILKILNSKGPLTYSELKAYAGFKSKKESGKFAYHLRKLLRQSLISLNKGEKKYLITNLGKMVLKLVRQIEERSLVESGKLYFRMIDRLEEFNTNRLVQSLIVNAGMLPEVANKIAEDVESKILKFDVSYLTQSLIMDIINSTLIENGYEEYRERLGRVGLPAFELSRLLTSEKGIEDLMITLSNEVLVEYMLFYNLPKDIADQHIEGNINILNTGLSLLTPDTIFIDASLRSIDDTYSLIRFIQRISKEVSREVVFSNLDLKIDSREIVRFLSLISRYHLPLISFRLDGNVESMLDGYRLYLESVELPNIGLIIEPNRISTEQLIDILQLGGLISISREERSILGIKKSNDLPIDISIHSVSINLPRLAYESDKDEEYFRAKLAMMMESALEAISLKKRTVSKFIDNAMLSILNEINEDNKIRMILNLIDPYTSIHTILGYNDPMHIMMKTIEAAKNVIEAKDEEYGLAIIDEDTTRLSMLDLIKYRKLTNEAYKQYIMIDEGSLDSYKIIDEELDGLSLILDLDSSIHMIDKLSNLHFVPRLGVYMCNKCKKKSRDAICKVCNTKSKQICSSNSIYINPSILK